jgi:N-acetylglutamate synthase-like GNAT family acetyltransferase
VEYLVRAARITDIDRVVALCDDVLRASRAGGELRQLDPGDLLRQLVFLPQATFLVAETRREIAGVAVLSLRPSVRAGGYVGTVDLLAVDPRHPVDGVADELVGELLRSASNKACTVVEAPAPRDDGERSFWERHGFSEAGPVLQRGVGRGMSTTTDGMTNART